MTDPRGEHHDHLGGLSKNNKCPQGHYDWPTRYMLTPYVVALKTINARKGIMTRRPKAESGGEPLSKFTARSKNNKCPQGHYDFDPAVAVISRLLPSKNNKCPRGHYDTQSESSE